MWDGDIWSICLLPNRSSRKIKLMDQVNMKDIIIRKSNCFFTIYYWKKYWTSMPWWLPYSLVHKSEVQRDTKHYITRSLISLKKCIKKLRPEAKGHWSGVRTRWGAAVITRPWVLQGLQAWRTLVISQDHRRESHRCAGKHLEMKVVRAAAWWIAIVGGGGIATVSSWLLCRHCHLMIEHSGSSYI